MRSVAMVGLLGLLTGCSSSGSSADAPFTPPDGPGPRREAAAPDVAHADLPRADSAAPVSPEAYCTTLVESFCAFYLRCGRVVATTPEACRAYFLETCGSRYQPFYLALVEAGLLQLSSAAVAACKTHLATVACDQQLHDLDGPCALWVGQQPAGGHCGIGIESLVCDSQSACAVSPSLCGACRALAAPGASCSSIEVTCGSNAACLGGTCRARVAVGQSCDATTPCVVSASCTGGLCVGPTFVGLDESCDASHRCRYGATCISKTCHKDAMLGEACGVDTACASGRCASAGGGGQTCQALHEAGQPCTTGGDCLSGGCLGTSCDTIPGACFQ
jgi:hypothetical protein